MTPQSRALVPRWGRNSSMVPGAPLHTSPFVCATIDLERSYRRTLSSSRPERTAFITKQLCGCLRATKICNHFRPLESIWGWDYIQLRCRTRIPADLCTITPSNTARAARTELLPSCPVFGNRQLLAAEEAVAASSFRDGRSGFPLINFPFVSPLALFDAVYWLEWVSANDHT